VLYKFLSVVALLLVTLYVHSLSSENSYGSESQKGLKPYKLTVAMMPSSGVQRSAYYRMLSAFEAHSQDVEVHVRAYEHENYKENIEQYLEGGPGVGEVFFWFGGNRLQSLIQKNLITNLTEVWQKEHWSDRFTTAAISAVSRNDQVHALPLNYYQWGIYYRKSMFEQHNLVPPLKWKDLLYACEILAKHGTPMFAIGSQSPWAVASWFDYLNLRLNGLEAHREITSGKASYATVKVQKVFEYWQEAIDAGCFIEGRQKLSWKEALPLMYYKKAAAVLMGNFFVSNVPDSVKEDLVFSPFPVIDPQMPIYEDAPVDVLVVARSAMNNPAVKKLLAYLSESDVLIDMNESINKLTPFKEELEMTDRFIQAGDQLLKQAQGVAQFYDRDTRPDMATPAMDLMVMFLNQELTKDEVQHTLEAYRKKVYGKIDTP